MAADAKFPVTVRPATPQDSAICGEICFNAFSSINAAHGFPCDLPNVETAVGILKDMFSNPDFYSVVAEVNGRIVGSNGLDERSTIKGVGPITIAPSAQNLGVGRKLMQAVLDRAKETNASGVRLVQAAFHNRSLSLYASLGFDIREPLSCFQGRTQTRTIPGCTVRPATPADLASCDALSLQLQGYDRGTELAQAISRGTAKVVVRARRITAYTSHIAFFGHSIAETNTDMQALIASADSFAGPGVLVPSRNSVLFRWCLANGLRVVQPMTLMSLGLYNDPTGAWLPSVLF